MAVRDGLIKAFFNAFIIKNMPAQRKMALRTVFSKPLCLRSEDRHMAVLIFSENIGMSACSDSSKNKGFFIFSINQKPVRLYVTLVEAFIISM